MLREEETLDRTSLFTAVHGLIFSRLAIIVGKVTCSGDVVAGVHNGIGIGKDPVVRLTHITLAGGCPGLPRYLR